MDKFERVMEVLEQYPEFGFWGKDNNVINMTEIMELLKQHYPRAMTLDEVCNSECPVYIEGGERGGQWAIVAEKPRNINYSLSTLIEFVLNGLYSDRQAFSIAEYGKSWQCWTSKPIKELCGRCGKNE